MASDDGPGMQLKREKENPYVGFSGQGRDLRMSVNFACLPHPVIFHQFRRVSWKLFQAGEPVVQ